MNPTAIYSKSGKGVQEASGKTSLLSRPDRAILSAIDGRATLNDVAVKVGKTFDAAFEKLIGQLDKDGFIREVSPGVAPPAAKGAAKPASKAAAPAPSMDPGSDLDFTAIPSGPSKSKSAVPPPQAPPRPAPPPPKPANIPPPPPPPSAAEKAKAEQAAKAQGDAMARAREEAERKAAADRERAKAEAEAKVRAETESKLRAEAEAKARAAAEAKLAAEAEAKVKAARDAAVKAAAEAKAKADAEAKRAREEADRVRREAEEKLRREQEEMKRKLEEERRAREEAERKAKEEARRLEEERRRLEEERKRREEEHRREEAERAARRKREEEEEAARRAERRKREEEEEARREAERAERKRRDQEEEERERAKRETERAERKRRDEEEEAREAAERDARRKSKKAEDEIALPEIEEEKPRPKAKAKEKAPEAASAKGGGSFADSLMADLDSFTTREEEDQKAREEEERKKKEEAARRAREAEERRQKEEAERREREEKARRKAEEEERRRKEEAELRQQKEHEEQRLKEEEEKRKKEADERERKAKQDEVLAAKASGRGQDAFAAEVELKKRRERQLGPAPAAAARAVEREKGGLGKPIAMGLFALLLVAFGVAHVVPIDVAPYQTAATDAFGKPVKIGSANLSLYSGLMIKFHDVAIGEAKIGEVRAVPEFSALTGAKKDLSRVEIEGLRLEQAQVGEALFASLKAENFHVGRILVHKLELAGPLALPKGLDLELAYDAEGALRAAVVRGPDALLLRITAKGKSADFEMDASSFSLPFAKEVSLAKFKAKGSATPQGATVDEWDGEVLGGRISGNANIRWGDNWNIDGVITARSITAAVFAPALLSEGKAEGSGKFGMRGDPGNLAETARIDGSFTVSRGVLGSIDLSRAIQTGGKQASGRTQFNELNGQGVYDRGAVSLRSVTLTAGQLNAGASVDISQGGALSGRIVADVKVSSQTLRATLNLGGTLKEPQVRN